MRRVLEAAKHNNYFPFVFSVIYFLVTILIISRHELWRDETQAWLISRESENIASLFKNLKYEGHPWLWHLIILPLTRLTTTPISMQILHIVISTSSVFILYKHAPFSWLEKLLLSYSYFLFYEYSVISRNYAISIFLIFLLCTVYSNLDKKLPIAAITLSLLAFTNIFSIIIAISIWISLVIRFYFQRNFNLKVLLLMMLILLSIASSVYQIIPPKDGTFATSWNWKFEASKLGILKNAALGAFFPIPEWKLNFWNSLAILNFPKLETLALVFLMLSLILGLIYFSKDRYIIFVICSSFLGCLAFFYLKYAGYIRHHGFLFLIAIMGFWMMRSKQTPSLPKVDNISILNSPAFFKALVISYLAINCAAGMFAAFQDYRLTFSQAKNTADFIKSKLAFNAVVVSEDNILSSSIYAYLPHGKIYAANTGHLGTFVSWNQSQKATSKEQVIKFADKAIKEHGVSQALLVFHSHPAETLVKEYNLKFLTNFTNGVVMDENYHLYEYAPLDWP